MNIYRFKPNLLLVQPRSSRIIAKIQDFLVGIVKLVLNY